MANEGPTNGGGAPTHAEPPRRAVFVCHTCGFPLRLADRAALDHPGAGRYLIYCRKCAAANAVEI